MNTSYLNATLTRNLVSNYFRNNTHAKLSKQGTYNLFLFNTYKLQLLQLP